MSDISVAVTGVGIVSPIGVGRDAFWSALCAGRSGIVPVEGLARDAGLPHIAAPVGEFPAKALITSPQLRRMDRMSRMAVAASRLALDDAGLNAHDVGGEDTGVVFGTSLGDLSDSIAHLDRIFTRGPAAASPMVFPNLVLNAAAGYVAMEYGCTGVNFTVAQHEISGEHAIALGCDVVGSGRAKLVLAGGGDELTPILVHAYGRARALASQRGGREWASPYDRERSGIVLGEGAAMLALEPLAAARARGAPVYAVLSAARGYAVAAPRYGWPARADAAASVLAPLIDDGIDVVFGAANSSRRLDACELRLFARLFPRAEGVAVTSIKGAVGEFGAAGALTVAAACLALREQMVPPLCHLASPETDARLRFVARIGERAALRAALVSGLARGGSGVALRFEIA
jgi:3-oxoacyl-[acyl-carrier-protein] synthase II